MNFCKITGFNPDWAHNQGFINSHVERLYKQDKGKLVDYVATLTEEERNLSRSHLETVLKLEKRA